MYGALWLLLGLCGIIFQCHMKSKSDNQDGDKQPETDSKNTQPMI